MARIVGTKVDWRFQGVKSSCWLTCIEMLMQCKYNCRYGLHDYQSPHGQRRDQHSALALDEYRKNEGSHIHLHASDYNLETNETLSSPNAGVHEWTRALTQGPVLAEGNYGWVRFGLFPHVILITGISSTGQLIYMNPNVMAVLPHPCSKESYASIRQIYEHREKDVGLGGPFWQVSQDVEIQRRNARRPRLPLDLGGTSADWGSRTRRLMRDV